MTRDGERLRVCLLGTFRVLVGRTPIDDAAWRTRHARTLIKRLALAADHRLHREVLIERLWPEASPERSARNLNKALHIARRALQPELARGSDSRFLRRRGESIALCCDAGLEIDALLFESAAKALLVNDTATDATELERALALYTGELLSEDRFDEDTETRRAALGELHRSLLLRSASLLETEGRLEAAIDVLQRVLVPDPCDEECHRGVMRAYARLGQRARALEQYALCVRALRDALDVEPATATRELHETIRSGRVGPEPAATPDTVDARARPALAIMPFDNPSLDPAIDYLCEGLAENLIRRVATATGARLLAWHTVATYRRRSVSPSEIGAELGVGRVLLGRILKRRSSLDVSIELVDTADGSLRWGERYSVERASVLVLLERMIGDVAARIGAPDPNAPPLPPRHGPGAGTTETNEVDAYHAYLKGRYHWNKRTGEELRTALGHFRAAIDIDPVYARAWSGLADGYNLLSLYSTAAPRETMPKARAAAQRALEIEPGLCEAHTSLGYYLLSYEWRFGAAEKSFRTALRLNPDYPTARQWYHKLLVAAGRVDEAARQIETAKLLDPLSPMIAAEEAWGLYHSRRFERAGEHLERLLAETPDFAVARYVLALVRLGQDRLDEALRALSPLVETPTVGSFALAHGLHGHLLARRGDAAAARRALAALSDATLAPGAAGYARALVHLGLGEAEPALTALGTALDERLDRMIFVPIDPLFDPLKRHPGFSALSFRPEGSAGADETSGAASVHPDVA